MIASHLTVPEKQGQTVARHRHNVMTGFGDPRLEAQNSRATTAAFLCPKYGSPYNGRAVWETEMSAGPLAGSPTCTVPLTRLATGKRSSSTALEDSIMATNATSTGVIRPTQNPPAISEIRWISEATATKRLRRHLATIGLQLVITRAGTNQRREWGELAILDNQGVIHSKSVNLGCSLKAHGLLADVERVEYRWDKFWLHHIARRVTVQVDGQSCIYHEQVTRDYSTVKAAKKAGEAIEDRTDLVLVSWDASRSTNGGTKNGAL